MTALFSKKKPNIISAEGVASALEPVFDLDKEIVIHAMPARFRARKGDPGRAQKTGLFILVSGGLFLLALAGAFYYFLFIYDGKNRQTASSTPGFVDIVKETKTKTAGETGQTATTAPESSASTSRAAGETVSTSTGQTATTAPESSMEIIATSTGQSDLVKATDGDKDGLSDAEEALLGTDQSGFDSDGDGYGDRAELENLYNPAGTGRLEDGGRIKRYSNRTYSYSLLHPASWAVSQSGGDYSIIFTAPDNQLVQIDVQPNAEKLSILDWYKEQFDLSFVDPGRLVEQKDSGGLSNWLGVKNEDGLTIYLSDAAQTSIITLNYNLGLGNTPSYPEIFDMMIRSFNMNPSQK